MPIPTLLAVVLAGAVSAGGGRPITLDWIFSDEGEAIGKSPEAQSTSGGDVLFLDPRRPKAARTLERFSPGTGAWIAVDPRAALASLSALLGGKDVPEELEWPPSFDGAGTSAAYAYGGDLFRLDLASSRFERLTATTAEEKIPGLSPDGRELAFVRGNDLWVLDRAPPPWGSSPRPPRPPRASRATGPTRS
jgi:hypothetical protein